MPSWYFLYERQPLSAAENMAVDEHLFDICHRQKTGFLRIYSWLRPTFSFGVSQKIDRAVNAGFIENHGYEYVRRMTGGKTVLHDDEITYAVASSEDVFFREHDPHHSYLLISRVLVDAFQSIGINASLSKGSSGEMARSHHPCFSFPANNEIEVDGKKIVGSAQKRDRAALLQHGSIPVTMNYESYAAGSNSNAEFIRSSMTTLATVSSVKKEDCVRAMVSSFSRFIGGPLAEFDSETIDRDQLKKLTEKYRSHEWNFRN